MSKELKRGDAVQFEYRDKYDRETGTGIVVKVEKDNFYRVVLIHKYKDRNYNFTNYEASLPIGKLKPLEKNIKDYGLSF